jgi:hypothetical protein
MSRNPEPDKAGISENCLQNQPQNEKWPNLPDIALNDHLALFSRRLLV